MRFDVSKSHRQRGLAGCSQWHRKELDMTESHTHTHTRLGLESWLHHLLALRR